jgi:dipeptidyl aminopeptidase/acylaminoacyl peptidase
MKRIVVLIMVGLLSACSATEKPQAVADACDGTGPVSIEQLLNARSLGWVGFSADGQRLSLASNQRGYMEPSELDPATGALQPVAPANRRVAYPLGYLPDGALLVTADDGGNEMTHLYAWRRDGASVDLTPGEGTAEFQGWAPDRKSFFFSTNARDPRYFDLYAVDATTFERKLLFLGGDYRLSRPGYGNDVAVSPDRSLVAVEKVVSNVRSDVYLREVATNKEWALAPAGEEVMSRPLLFDPSGEALYYISDVGSEYQQLYRYELKSRNSKLLVAAQGDVQFARFSPAGNYLLVGVNARGATELQVYDWPSFERRAVTGLPKGVGRDLQFAPDGKRAAIVFQTTTSPGDIYILDLETRRATELASAWPTDSVERGLVAGSDWRYTSFDGLEISGIVYAARCSSGAARKAVIWLHGGPNAQSEFSYHSMAQLLATRGYTVLALNQRGSGGYGKTFARLDDRRQGGDDLKDIVAAAQALAKQGFAEPGRIALSGGSFGGFHTLATITTYPKSFRAAIDFFGVANWERTLRSVPKSWASRRAVFNTEFGDPDVPEDAARLRAISPLFRAETIQIPLMVVQGVNDPRVLQIESDEVVAGARRAGVPVEYLLLEGEGHNWPALRANERRVLEQVVQFLAAYL